MTPYFSKQKILKQKGAVVIVAVLLFIIISGAIIFAVANPLADQIRAGSDFVRGTQSYINAKVSSDDALYRLNKGSTLPTTFSFGINQSSSTATVTDLGTIKQIVSEGVAEQLIHTIQTSLTQSPVIPILYGAQVGAGGATLSDGASIEGDVYSTGDVLTSGGANITGNVFKEVPQSLLIFDSEINGWKTEAGAGVVRDASWTITGSTTASTTGAEKINGDLNISEGGKLIINGTLYVTGNINLTGDGEIELGTDFGTNAGLVVVDGKVNLSTGGSIMGNGNAGSYVVVVSTNSSCSDGVSCSNYAITTSGGAESAVLIAQDGGVYLTGGTTTPAVIANYLKMDGGAKIQYNSSLSGLIIEGGSGGWWSVLSSKEVNN